MQDGKYDILVGTQMVAKGLNFPNVTLVGVLNTDYMLYADDYRSYERTFSLLTQVVGRSGRGASKGMAVIQSYTPRQPNNLYGGKAGLSCLLQHGNSGQKSNALSAFCGYLSYRLFG